MQIDITRLRKAGGSDQAILDLLQLLDLGLVPGQPRTKELEALWGCHQSTVSRRMAAICELRCCRVITAWGFYRVTDEAPLPKKLPPAKPDTQLARLRWENLRQRWREVAA